MIKVINTTPGSVTFDIDDGGKYKTLKSYTVNIRMIGKTQDAGKTVKNDKSILTVFGLEADAQYLAEVIFDGEGEAAPEFKTTFATEPVTVRVNVKELGAFGDGEHDDTAFIQSAIMCCPAGGLVIIPEGTYLHRGIYLKSDISIEIRKGAKLVLDSNRENIPRFPGRLEGSNGTDEYFLGTWEGEPKPMFNGTVKVSNGIDAMPSTSIKVTTFDNIH